MYGKATETAIAAMSRLAEVWDDGATRLSATDIAEARGLQKPFVGKILTALAQAKLVRGTRGPGGGFILSRPPSEIQIDEVFRLFEREDSRDICPFGGGICGVGVNCALHDKLVSVQDSVDEVLNNTTFEVFRKAFQDDKLRPTQPEDIDGETGPRASYRAPHKRKGQP
jgi:Rrf2 family protein